MPLPDPPKNVVRVVATGLNGAEPWANVMHVLTDVAGTPDASDVSSLAENLRGKWAETFSTVQNENATFEEMSLTWYGGDGTFVDGLAVDTVVGEDTGAPLDCATSVLVSWRVAASWRGGHPRTYLAGVSQDRLDTPGTYTSGTLSDYQDMTDAWLGLVNSITSSPFGSVTLGCLRTYSGGVPLDPPVFVPFVAGTVRSVPGTQRRRLR